MSITPTIVNEGVAWKWHHDDSKVKKFSLYLDAKAYRMFSVKYTALGPYNKDGVRVNSAPTSGMGGYLNLLTNPARLDSQGVHGNAAYDGWKAGAFTGLHAYSSEITTKRVAIGGTPPAGRQLYIEDPAAARMMLKATGASGHAIVDLDNDETHAELGVYADDRFKIYMGGLTTSSPRFEIDKSANVFVKGKLCIGSTCIARQDFAEHFSRLDALIFTAMAPGYSFPRIALRFHDRVHAPSSTWARNRGGSPAPLRGCITTGAST